MALLIGIRNETNKDGSVLLHVRFQNKQIDKKIYTQIKVLKKYWDKKNKTVKPNHPCFEQKSKQIKKLKDIVHDLKMQNIVSSLSYEEARYTLTNGSYVNNINSFLDQYLKSQIKETTFKDYKSKIQSIGKNLGIDSLRFEDISDKNNWIKLKDILNEKERSPVTFNSYYKAAKSIHSHALKDEITFSVFPYVRYNSENNYTPDWLKYDELIKIINNLNSNNKGFKNDATSILIYLMMFSMRGMYRRDIDKLSMEEFVESTYDNCANFSFGERNMVYRHFRSKTNKMGLIYLGLYPVREIILSLNHIINPTSNSLFPVFGGNMHPNFWSLQSKRFKKLTSHNFKSARKAFNTIASINNIPDYDIRELMFQQDKTISKHYKDTQAQEMLAKYSTFHFEILIKYSVHEMFQMIIYKLIENGQTELSQLLRLDDIIKTINNPKINSTGQRVIKKVRHKNDNQILST